MRKRKPRRARVVLVLDQARRYGVLVNGAPRPTTKVYGHRGRWVAFIGGRTRIEYNSKRELLVALRDYFTPDGGETTHGFRGPTTSAVLLHRV